MLGSLHGILKLRPKQNSPDLRNAELANGRLARTNPKLGLKVYGIALNPKPQALNPFAFKNNGLGPEPEIRQVAQWYSVFVWGFRVGQQVPIVVRVYWGSSSLRHIMYVWSVCLSLKQIVAKPGWP